MHFNMFFYLLLVACSLFLHSAGELTAGKKEDEKSLASPAAEGPESVKDESPQSPSGAAPLLPSEVVITRFNSIGQEVEEPEASQEEVQILLNKCAPEKLYEKNFRPTYPASPYTIITEDQKTLQGKEALFSWVPIPEMQFTHPLLYREEEPFRFLLSVLSSHKLTDGPDGDQRGENMIEEISKISYTQSFSLVDSRHRVTFSQPGLNVGVIINFGPENIYSTSSSNMNRGFISGKEINRKHPILSPADLLSETSLGEFNEVAVDNTEHRKIEVTGLFIKATSRGEPSGITERALRLMSAVCKTGIPTILWKENAFSKPKSPTTRPRSPRLRPVMP
jgi:hypothetical protein